jgi:hypothetical protein
MFLLMCPFSTLMTISRARFLTRSDVLQFRHRLTQSREICCFCFRKVNRLFGEFGGRGTALENFELLWVVARKLGAGFVGPLNFSLANPGVIRANEDFDGRVNRIRNSFSHVARPLLLLMACGEVHIYAKTQINY